MVGQVELGPRQEHQEGQSEIGESGNDVVRMRQIQHIGTERDAQEDLEHDLRNGEKAAEPFGELRRKTAATRSGPAWGWHR